MDERLTLEEQIRKAKIEGRMDYAGNMLRVMEGERSEELHHRLNNPSTFVRQDATRLLAEIMADYEMGKYTPAEYVRKPQNSAAFAYLAFLDLVEVQEHPYLRIFKRKVIVPKERSTF